MFGDQGRVIAAITMRATMGRKRALLFAIPGVILLLVTVLLKLAHPHDPTWPSQVDGVFGFTVVLPLTALIIGTSVLGAEVDDGSIVHLLATPVPRLVVIWSKYVVAVVLTAAFVAVPELLAGLIATGGRLLSVGHYSLGVANGIAHDGTNLNAGVSFGTSVVMGVIVTAVTIVIAVRALSSFSLKGDAI